MSLLVDPDYAIYTLRLAYLRKIDDHAGPRVITFPSISNLLLQDQGAKSKTIKSSSSDVLAENEIDKLITSSPGGGAGLDNSIWTPLPPDSHVVIAGLNDARYQPELATLYSPKLKESFASLQDNRVDLFGGSGKGSSRSLSQSDYNAEVSGKGKSSGGLKYTSTIFGPGRTGALGMRVNGRRAMSGDIPRRMRRASKDDSLAEEELDNEESSNLTGNTRRMNNGQLLNIPNVKVQPSEGDTKRLDGKTQRSASFRLPSSKREDDPAWISLRNRSSSQPQHPLSIPSETLDSGNGMDEVDEQGEVGTKDMKDKHVKTPSTSSLPPSRPPRSSHRSEPNRVEQESRNDAVLPLQGASFLIKSRRRSASEGANQFMRVQERSNTPKAGEVEEEDEGEEETESLQDPNIRHPSQTIAMSRMNSDSTILSLASPPKTRKRGLSDRSQRSDGINYDPHLLSPLSSAKESLASYKLTVNPADISFSYTSRNRAMDSSSPFSRKAILSDSVDASDSFDGRIQSDTSSVRLENSSGFNSPAQGLYENISNRLLEPDQVINSDLQENVALSSGHKSAAPIRSALGLDVSWNLDGVAKQQEKVVSDGLQESPILDHHHGRVVPPPHQPSKRLLKKRSVSQHRAGLEAQRKQQFFTSLKTDQNTVTQRFEARPQKSGISALLSKHSEGPENPFATPYKGIGSLSTGPNTSVEVYFPFANSDSISQETKSNAKAVNVKSKSMSLSVRKDATMEEVIGFSLYCYVEEGWKPDLDEERTNEDDRAVRLSTLGWTLRIVEDGEVDDDYPAIDRSLLVGKFGADELAICEATPSQIKQHKLAMPKIQQRPTQSKQLQQSQQGTQLPSTLVSDPSTQQIFVPVGPSARLAAATGNIPAGSLVSFGGTPIIASSALSKSIMAPMNTSIFLRVLITPNSEVKYKTTLQVPSDMYLADVLETICKKRQLADVDQWALIVPEKDIVVPLDRTVESLQGNHDLALVKRQDLGEAGSGALTGQSTNPSASIFKRLSKPLQKSSYRTGKEIASTYKSYTVNRKQASFLGRHERIFTIDGDWIHIM